MRSIALINQKGGAGKTTTAVNVAAALARAGQRVLLVDLDSQSHTSLHLGVQLQAEDRGVYDVLVGNAALRSALREVSARLVLLPASIDLVGAELELHEREDGARLLRDALATCRNDFDYCLIDCPPSLGQMTVSALVAADEIIIPLQPHFLALQGLGRLLETVSLARQVLNPELRVSGIALCMFETGTRLAQEVLEDIRQFVRQAGPHDPWWGARVFETKVRRNIKLAECPSFGQTIFDYAPSSHGAEDYLALTQEILAMTAAAAPAAAAATPPVSKPVAEVVPQSDAALLAAEAAPPPAKPAEPRSEPTLAPTLDDHLP